MGKEGKKNWHEMGSKSRFLLWDAPSNDAVEAFEGMLLKFRFLEKENLSYGRCSQSLSDFYISIYVYIAVYDARPLFQRELQFTETCSGPQYKTSKYAGKWNTPNDNTPSTITFSKLVSELHQVPGGSFSMPSGSSLLTYFWDNLTAPTYYPGSIQFSISKILLLLFLCTKIRKMGDIFKYLFSTFKAFTVFVKVSLFDTVYYFSHFQVLGTPI